MKKKIDVELFRATTLLFKVKGIKPYSHNLAKTRKGIAKYTALTSKCV